VSSPIYLDHVDLTSTKIQYIYIYIQKYTGIHMIKKKLTFVLTKELTLRFTTRTDDSHAIPLIFKNFIIIIILIKKKIYIGKIFRGLSN
jgi:hypothetical protein